MTPNLFMGIIWTSYVYLWILMDIDGYFGLCGNLWISMDIHDVNGFPNRPYFIVLTMMLGCKCRRV